MTFIQQYVGQHIIKVNIMNRSMYNPVLIDIYIVLEKILNNCITYFQKEKNQLNMYIQAISINNYTISETGDRDLSQRSYNNNYNKDTCKSQMALKVSS